MSTAAYLEKLERDMTGGFLHLLILLHMARLEPIHGYGLIKAMEESTGRRSLWKEGTVYPLLATLEREGLLHSRWGRTGPAARRKYYGLTAAGRQVLRLGTQMWADLRNTLDTLMEETE